MEKKKKKSARKENQRIKRRKAAVLEGGREHQRKRACWRVCSSSSPALGKKVPPSNARAKKGMKLRGLLARALDISEIHRWLRLFSSRIRKKNILPYRRHGQSAQTDRNCGRESAAKIASKKGEQLQHASQDASGLKNTFRRPLRIPCLSRSAFRARELQMYRNSHQNAE